MPLLPRSEVEEIALLARLHLEPVELDQLQSDLGVILEHFSVLAAVDVEGIAPMTHAIPSDLELRADTVLPSLPVDVALAAAPRRAGDLIEVPAIISDAEGRRGGGEGS